MSAAVVGCFARIDNGEPIAATFEMRTDYLDVTCQTELDPTWQLVDAAGHYHAASRSAGETSYPTLKTRVIRHECVFEDHDEDCDGADETVYECVLCDERVRPGWRPGTPRTVPGRTTYQLTTVHIGQLFDQSPRSVAVIRDNRVASFGIAEPVTKRVDSDQRVETLWFFTKFGSRATGAPADTARRAAPPPLADLAVERPTIPGEATS